MAERNPEALELIKRSPQAFIMLYIVAFRARFAPSRYDPELQLGESLIGWQRDFQCYGFSAQQYRTCKLKLEKLGFITCKATDRGTIVRLVDTRVFDVSRFDANTQPNRPATDQPQSTHRPPTCKVQGIPRKPCKPREHIFLRRTAEEDQFFEKFSEAFEAKWGAPYVDRGRRDTEALRDLLEQLHEENPSDLVDVLRAGWDGPGYWSARTQSVVGFCQHFNEIRAEANGEGSASLV
jgi:hypothetical protein